MIPPVYVAPSRRRSETQPSSCVLAPRRLITSDGLARTQSDLPETERLPTLLTTTDVVRR